MESRRAGTDRLRVLLANERKDRLAQVARVVAALGHEVIAREVDVSDVGPLTAREQPDVALVELGQSSEHALALIDKIVNEAACPVIAVLHGPDAAFVKEASRRGVFAHITDTTSRTGRARLTSFCAALPNTTSSKGRSDAAR